MRALDTTHDWKFGQGKQDYNYKNDAINENVQTRLMSFVNDCFFDLTAGLDWFRLLSSKSTLEQLKLDARAVILGSEGVVKVNSLDVELLEGRGVKLTYDIDTIYTRRFSQNIEVLNG